MKARPRDHKGYPATQEVPKGQDREMTRPAAQGRLGWLLDGRLSRTITRPSPPVEVLDRSRAASSQGWRATQEISVEQPLVPSRLATNADIIGNKKPLYHKARAASKNSTAEQSRELSRPKRSI